MSEMAHQIKVSDKTYDELTELGKKNETYDDIVARLIDFYKSNEGKGKK